MKYEKPSQTAKRLGVTARAIQKWANDGRIYGAYKIANQWMIPTDFTAPLKKDSVLPFVVTPTMPVSSIFNSSFSPGECLAYIDTIQDEDVKTVIYAEYLYYRGDAEQATVLLEPYLNSPDHQLRNTAMLTYIFANLSLGHIHLTLFSLEFLLNELNIETQGQKPPSLHAIDIFNTVTIFLRTDTDKIEALENWIRYLDKGTKLYACYLVARSMYIQNMFQGAHAISKIAIELCPEKYVIPLIHCKLIDAIALINLKHIEDAKNQFMLAWELAYKDGFLEPFAEHYHLLQGLTEQCLKNTYPKEYKRITEIAAIFGKHCNVIHNILTNKNITNELTPTEFTIAMMYTRDWRAKEIAAHLGMSVRTVYRNISNIYSTLGIRNVADLKKYMLN